MKKQTMVTLAVVGVVAVGAYLLLQKSKSADAARGTTNANENLFDTAAKLLKGLWTNSGEKTSVGDAGLDSAAQISR